MDEIECAVIGAGVVGLAIARAIAQRRHEVIIVEMQDAIGTETSSRNNEVIHAGFLQPKTTLKGRLCAAGREPLYRYCTAHGVPHQRIGKLVVATDDEEARVLAELLYRARENGVAELTPLTPTEARAREPALRCCAALHSPSSGIVDAHALMLALLGDAETAGALLALQTRALTAAAAENHFLLRTEGTKTGPFDIRCRILINAAGLGASALARMLTGADAPMQIPPIHHAKGSFFSWRGAPPFARLIVPVLRTLENGGAFTLDLARRGKFGPDVEWTEGIDYTVDPRRAAHFIAAIRRYYPDLAADRLVPDYAGIRPRVQGPGDPPGDWRILGPQQHGTAGLVHLLGIETPGLTACLAIADYVAGLVLPSSSERSAEGE